MVQSLPNSMLQCLYHAMVNILFSVISIVRHSQGSIQGRLLFIILYVNDVPSSLQNTLLLTLFCLLLYKSYKCITSLQDNQLLQVSLHFIGIWNNMETFFSKLKFVKLSFGSKLISFPQNTLLVWFT